MASSADDTSAQQPIEDTEDLVYKARLAEQAERYDEMADLMKKVAQMKKLSVEERNLLSVAFKNAVGARRASWRIMSSVETKQKSKQNDQQVKLAASYRKTVEDELHKICQDILELLDKSLIPGADDAESKVFYYKMKGDYYRYISEFSCDKQKATATEAANEAYEEATRIASQELTATHPIRLGLALNFSVFFYEIMGKPRKACEMAHCAFEDALPGLEHVCEESYRDSTLIMQLLRDNLALWTSDTAAAEKEQPPNQGAGAPQATAAAAGGEPAPAPQAPAAETPESSRKEM